MYSETMPRRYTHRGAYCESNAPLWSRNMSQCSDRTL